MSDFVQRIFTFLPRTGQCARIMRLPEVTDALMRSANADDKKCVHSYRFSQFGAQMILTKITNN